MEPTTIEGIRVSPIGLGTSRLASLGAGHSLREVARLLDAAFDLGVTFIDTADTYGSTTCERWLGEAMRGRPHRFVVATKCGLPTADLPGPLHLLNQPAKKILQRVGRDHYLEPGYVRRSIDASLRRLRRERIELFLLHSPPPGVEHITGLFEVLDEAKTRGKIGEFGVSTEDLRIIEAVSGAWKCRIAQTPVNPLTIKALKPFLDRARDGENLELVANSAFMDGNSLSQPVSPIAEPGLTKAQRLIRNAAALSQVKVVLVGTSNPAHLAEDVAALATPATHEDLLT